MPTSTDTKATPEMEQAAREFYSDFQRLVTFHDEIRAMVAYRGRHSGFDAGLKAILERQRGLMFELRNLYVDAYDLLPADKRAEVFRWIQLATGELQSFSTGLSSLGIAPLIIVAGVLLAAATATALVAWHREISAQRQALDNQALMIPLVEAGLAPGEVLIPVAPASGLSSLIGSVSTVALIIAVIYGAVQLFGGRK